MSPISASASMANSERTVSVIEESYEAQELSTTYEERSWTVVCSGNLDQTDDTTVTMTLPGVSDPCEYSADTVSV